MRRNFSLAEASCAQLSARVAAATGLSGPLWLDSPAMEEASRLILHAGEEGAPTQEVRRLYREAFSSDAFFRGADLALCVCPCFACAVLGALDAMAEMPLAVLAQTTASLAEGRGGCARGRAPWTPSSSSSPAPALAGPRRLCPSGPTTPASWPPRLFLSEIFALLPVVLALALHGMFDAVGWQAGWEVHLANSYTYPELQMYTAALFVPWDWVLVAFSELYRIGLPLIVPEAVWMHGTIAMGTSYRRHSPETWRKYWMGRFVALFLEAWGHCSGERSRGAGNASGVPFVDSAPGPPPLLEQIAWWNAQTEYERFPLVRRFSSFADLARLLEGLEPAARAGGWSRVPPHGAGQLGGVAPEPPLLPVAGRAGPPGLGSM